MSSKPPATTPATNSITTLRDMLQRQLPAIKMALPQTLGISPERVMRVVLTTAQRTPRLLQCQPMTVLGAVMECSQLGLMPDGVLGHAYLVPYGDKCQLQVGYKGLIDLARRSGNVLTISAEAVYENDEFDWEKGMNHKLRFKPRLTERGEVYAFYADAHLRDGGYQFVVMSKGDVLAVREKTEGWKAFKAGRIRETPWQDEPKGYFNEMAKKTCIRALCKYLPLSAEAARAVSLDEMADAGVDQGLGDIIDLPPQDFQEAGEKGAAAAKEAAMGGKE
jgi:recombination protein RecT